MSDRLDCVVRFALYASWRAQVWSYGETRYPVESAWGMRWDFRRGDYR